MSQEDVELVRAAYKAWNDRDMDAALSFADPNIEVVQDSQIPGATTAKGRDEFRAWLEGFYDTWERFELSVQDVRQVGDRIVVVAQVRALGRTTGVPVEARIAHVLTVRDQQAVRWESYTRPDEALEAVGLSE